jgi:cell division protein FtsB
MVSRSTSKATPRARGRSGARRRRLVLALLTMLLLPAAVFVNLGPYQQYTEAQEKLGVKEQEVALLEQEIAALEDEMKRLEDEYYLEALARKELAYARPGEEVFVVKGLDEGAFVGEDESDAPEPGPVERLVHALRGLF